MPFDPNSNENNRNLQAAGFKAFPTVDARGAAGAEPPPGLKMPRTNSGK